MVPFKDNDEGYLAWLSAHPDGFVVNTYRRPKPSYLRLHAAACRMINGTPTNGRRWTGEYIKFCDTRGELETWATTRVGGPVQPCPLCL
jgi:hypothetical protein